MLRRCLSLPAIAICVLLNGQHATAQSVETHDNPVGPGQLSIDTDRSDWEGIPWYTEDFEDERYPVDINQVRIAHDEDNVYFHITAHQWDAGDELWRLGLYIDSDLDNTTGYNGNFLSIGADVLVEVDAVYGFTAEGQALWGWEERASGLPFDQSTFVDKELAIPRSVLGDPEEFDFLLFANNFCCDFGEVDDAYPDTAAALDGEFFTYALGDVPVGTLPGDYDNNGVYEVADIDILIGQITAGEVTADYDLNSDGSVDATDLAEWVHAYGKTWVGDSNLDGEFNSTDLVQTFQSGEYEDGVAQNSGWSTGDWNGDSEFDTQDFVAAFQDGGFEVGPRVAVVAVPEPSMAGWLLGAFVFLLPIRRR